MAVSAEDVWKSFSETAAHNRGRTALRGAFGELTFGQLERRSLDAAEELLELGIVPGQLVAVAGGDASAFVSLVLAAMCISAPPVLLASAQRDHVLRAVLDGVGVAWLVTDEKALANRAAGLARADAIPTNSFACVRGSGGARTDESLAIVKLSSGSTGDPKAIGVSAAAVLAEADAVAKTFALGPGLSMLCPVPLHHSYGFDLGVLPMVSTGATLVVHTPLVPPRLVRQLEESGVRVFLGVPAIYAALQEMPHETLPDLSGVPYLLSCTAPLSTSAIERFHQRFGVAICQHYGASEAGAVTTHVPAEVLRRPASVGRAMPGVEIEIVDGEVTVSGPALSTGYLYGAPTPSPFRQGRFHMGDDGSLDSDGFLTVTGRRDALINVGGFKVSPAEVERVLERHPAVREAVVSGRSDGRGGELVWAMVAVRGEVTESELVAHCRSELEESKVPRRIEVRAALPRLPSGKVDRRG